MLKTGLPDISNSSQWLLCGAVDLVKIGIRLIAQHHFNLLAIEKSTKLNATSPPTMIYHAGVSSV